MLQIAWVVQQFMCHVHYYGRIYNWFVKKLVNVNHPALLLVGACLCHGLQSRSPRFPKSFSVVPK